MQIVLIRIFQINIKTDIGGIQRSGQLLILFNVQNARH